MLVYLAYQGSWVRRESLLTLFWPETPEAQARANLRQLLHSLRRSPYLTGLEITDARLRWPVSTDVAAFRAALDEDDFAAVTDLYTGPLLAEFDPAGSGNFGEWLSGEREGLFFAYRSAVLARARTLRQRGAVDELAELLGQLLRHDPFDEDVLCEQLGALMEAGHYRRALAAYEAFRARLRRELGAAPGRATRELVAQLRAAEADAPSGEATRPLPTTPAPATPPPNRCATDVGEAGTAGATGGQILSVPAPVPTLTLRASSAFVGRRQEQGAALQRLADPACRLLTLVGPGGVGKTRLAVELSAVAEGFEGGVVMVPLEAVSDVQLLAPTLAACLGLTLDAPETSEQQVIAHLSGRACLLILDNFEQLLARKAFLLELLARAPDVKLLVTTRERLGVAEEVALELRGLSLVGTGAHPADAVALFLHGARRVGVTLRREAELHHAAAICALVEGVPLALELTSAWLQFLTPAEVETELKAGLDLLVAPDADLPERHRNMRLVLARSWARLEEDEQRALARLSVFRGGFDYTAAKAVTGMSSGVLLALVYKSFLYRGAAGRFGLHELVRQYAAEQLAASGEEAATRRTHAQFFLAFALESEAALRGSEQVRWLGQLEAEHDNLRSALRWAGAHDPDLELELVGALFVFWDLCSHFAEGRGWLEAALGRANEAPQAARAKALNAAGTLARMQGDHAASLNLLAACLELCEHLGDPKKVAAALNNLGHTAENQHDLAAAHAYFERALTAYRSVGERWGEASVLNNLGNIVHAENSPEAARPLFEASLSLFRELGDDRSVAMALGNLGELAAEEGDHVKALPLLNEAVAALWSLGDSASTLYVLERLAASLPHGGEPARAAQLYGATAALREAMSIPLEEADRGHCEANLATVRAALSPEAWAEMYRAGSLLTLEDAVAVAVDGSGNEKALDP